MFFRHKKKKIGVLSAAGFAIGAMIGAGVFVLSGRAVAEAGPSAVLSFIIAGITVLLSALSLVRVVQSAGRGKSGYDAVGDIFSPVMTLIVSWSFYISSAVGVAFVLHSFGLYVQEFIAPQLNVVMLAIVALVALLVINAISTRVVGHVENVLVAIKLLVLVLFIAFGITAIQPSDFMPFFSQGADVTVSASATLFIAFLGFSTITSISAAVDNPKKNVPRATLLSMLVVTVVYVGVCVAMLAAGLSSYDEASVGAAAQVLMGPAGGTLVVLGALVATLSAANASLLGSSELMIRLAARKYVPTFLARQFRGHPVISLVGVAAITIALLIWSNVGAVIDIANVTAIIGLAVIDLAALKLAAKTRDAKWIVIASLAFITVGLQLFMIAPRYIVWGLAAIAVGLVFYAFRHVLHTRHHHKHIERAVKRGDTPMVTRLGGHER